MSLNRCEQRLFDYLRNAAEERQFWVRKVQLLPRSAADAHAAASRLEGELWRYYVERTSAVPALREAGAPESLSRTSMRNLAELLIRLWTEPAPKRSGPDSS